MVFEVVATLDDNISTVLFEMTVWKTAATLFQNVSEKIWEELRRFPNGEGECSWTRQDKKQQNVCSTNWETERSEKAADSFCWFAAFFFFFFGNLQLKWPSSLAVVDRHWPWPRTSTSTTSTASASSTTSTTTYHHRRRQNGGDGGGSGGRHYFKLFVVHYKIAPPSTVIDLSLPPMYLTVQVCVCMSSKPQHFIHTHLFASTSIFGSFLVPFKWQWQWQWSCQVDCAWSLITEAEVRQKSLDRKVTDSQTEADTAETKTTEKNSSSSSWHCAPVTKTRQFSLLPNHLSLTNHFLTFPFSPSPADPKRLRVCLAKLCLSLFSSLLKSRQRQCETMFQVSSTLLLSGSVIRCCLVAWCVT